MWIAALLLFCISTLHLETLTVNRAGNGRPSRASPRGGCADSCPAQRRCLWRLSNSILERQDVSGCDARPWAFRQYCSGPDFAVYTLGTCKHVEALLVRIGRRTAWHS